MSAKILVADESPTIHKIVAMAFENEGMTVEGISRGEHVLEYMVDFKPDIVLADIHLPGLDGYQLSREIKDSGKFPATRIILLTSDFEDVDEEALKRSQADDTVSKPFKSEEILKKVKSQLLIGEPEKEAPAPETGSPSEPGRNDVIQSEFEDIVSQEKATGQDSVKPSSPKDKRPEETKASEEIPEPSIEHLDVETSSPPASGKTGESQTMAGEAEASETGETEASETGEAEASETGEAEASETGETEASETGEAEASETGEAEASETGETTEPRNEDPQKNEADTGILAAVSEEAFQDDSHLDIAGSDEFYAVFQSVIASPEFGMGEGDEDFPAPEPGAKPNLIEETLALMARRNIEEEPDVVPQPVAGEKPPVEPEASADLSLGHRVVEAHVDQVKGRLPEGTVKGTDSATLETTVRKLLGEVAPEIIRKVIQEEIENIKKMEEA